MTLSFTIPHTELRKAVSTMARVIERRNTIPALGYCLIDVSAGQVSFSGTDLDSEITLTLEAKTSGKGSMMVDAGMLRGICGAMVGDVKLSKATEKCDGKMIRESRSVIHVSDGDASITLNDIMDPIDYPGIHKRWTKDHDENSSKFTMAQADLDRLFRLSRHCISDEATRYYLSGLFLTNKPDGTTLRGVSTDGHRLAVIDTDCETSGEVKSIVPSKVLRLITSLIDKKANEPVSVSLGETIMQFHKDGILMTSKLIDGTYPDYTRVIPKQTDAISVNLGADGLKRVSAFASISERRQFGSRVLKIDLEDGQMEVSSPEGNKITFPCQAKSNGVATKELGFNYRYLMDQSRITPSFRLRTASASDPAIIDSEDANAFWVLMSMRV